MENQLPPARLQITLRPGPAGPIFKVAVITESEIQWLTYDAEENSADQAAIRAARHVPGRRVVWWGRL